MELMSADPASAPLSLDGFAYLLMAGTACCAWPPAAPDASLRLERLLVLLILHATTLVLWNALAGADGAWTRWCAALLPCLSIHGLLQIGTALRVQPLRSARAASALLGLFWVNGLLR